MGQLVLFPKHSLMQESQEMNTQSSCCGGQKRHGKKGLVLGSIAVSTLLIMASVAAGAWYVNYSALEREYARVGSREAYDLLNAANRIQFEKDLPNIRSFVESAQKGGTPAAAGASGTTTPPTTPAAPATNGTLTQEKIASIKKNAHFWGEKDARIMVIEYSDLECPFCIRQNRDGVIEKLHAKYGKEMVSLFKNFRAVPHQNAEVEAVASLCAAKIGGDEIYRKYYQTIFTRSAGGNGTGFAKEALSPLAKELGIDQKKFDDCMGKDYQTMVAQYNTDTAEGREFGITGTPGNVIVDTKTGKYIRIDGAYPLDTFTAAIDSLIKG